MLNKMITWSLANRAVIIAISILIMVMGMRTATELPVEVLPDLTKPTVTILTEAPGLSPEEVEAQVTVPRKTRSIRSVCRHFSVLPDDERTSRYGIPVTSAVRAVLDLAAGKGEAAAESALREMEYLGCRSTTIASRSTASGPTPSSSASWTASDLTGPSEPSARTGDAIDGWGRTGFGSFSTEDQFLGEAVEVTTELLALIYNRP